MEAHHSLIALGLAIERFPREGVAKEVEMGTFPTQSPIRGLDPHLSSVSAVRSGRGLSGL